MHGFDGGLARERMNDALAEAGKRRVAREIEVRRPSLRARMAKRLFEAAVAMERDAAWSAVWEKMEAPKGSLRSGE